MKLGFPRKASRSGNRGLSFRALLMLGVAAVVFFGLSVSVFSADVPIATIPVGEAPVAVGVNPVSHRVYVANYYGNSVSVIDGVSDTVTSTVPLGDWTIPLAVVANPIATPARAYVANFWDNSITIIDETTNAETATVPSNGTHAGGPRAMALNPSGPTPKLYVGDYGSGFLTIFNAETYEEITHILVGDSPRAMAVFSSIPRTRVYVANRNFGTLVILDGETDTILETLSLGGLPKAIAIDNSTGFAYVTQEGANTVSVVDDSDQVTATVSVGARPTGIAVDEVNGRVFVANYDDGTVSVLRTSDFTHEATITVGTNPWAIAFDAGDEKAFVTNYGSNTTSVIDNTLSATTVTCGANPYALAIDEGATPHKTYVGNWNSNNVTVIDEPAAPPALGALELSEAHAVDEPVLVTIDPVPDTSGGTAVVDGTATGMRPVYPAAITAVFYRVAPDTTWRRAAITGGEFTADVTWEADLGALADGAYDIEVMALDQTSAIAFNSEGGTAVTAASAGGFAQATIEVGAEEPHGTVTDLVAIAPPPPKNTGSTLAATVGCAEPGCTGPTGQVVFEFLGTTGWEPTGVGTLVDGAASLLLDKKATGEFRARYLGDEFHEESTSNVVYVSRNSKNRPVKKVRLPK